MMKRAISLLILRSFVFGVVLAKSSIAFSATSAPPADDAIARTLIVSFDPALLPTAVGDVESDVSAQSGSLFDSLQKPLAAKRLLYRAPTAAELRIAEIDPHAPEAMIANYIRVTYAMGTNLDAVTSEIVKDRRIQSVERMGKSSFSSAPTDEYYVSGGPFQERQWGMQQYNAISNLGGMSFASAWDLVKGSAYVNVLDVGIQSSDSKDSLGIHPDLSANFRQQFSRNMSNLAANFLHFGAVDEWYEEVNDQHAGYYGHGTHVAGIVAATSSLSQTTNSSSPVGVTGGCFNCSLMITKVSGDLFNEIIYATDVGAQVLNRSGFWGVTQPGSCVQWSSICDALARARNRGVVFIAASGNQHQAVDFPANATSTADGSLLAIAVGGLQYDGHVWVPGYGTELGSNFGSQQALIAPAKDVLSTTYRRHVWSPVARCGDQLNSDTNLTDLVLHEGYGDCNGTSMAAPHVSALAGLVKSADPLLNTPEVREKLVSSGSNWPTHFDDKGYGVPDAGKAVHKSLNGYGANDPIVVANNVVNRLTPLFSLFSPKALDHFYTAVPQMAAAALDGTLKPQPSAKVFVGSSEASSWPVCCTQVGGACSYAPSDHSCGGKPVPLPGVVTIYEADGVTKVGGMPVAFLSDPTNANPDTVLKANTSLNFGFAAGNTSPYYGAVSSSSSPGSVGQLPGTNLTFPPGETNVTLYAYPLNFLSITYNVLDKDFAVDPNNPLWPAAIARKLPEYTAFPAYLFCPNPINPNGLVSCPSPYLHQPTASVRVYTSHKNPSVGGGPDLVPLYRLSLVCRDVAAPGCASNPYHISHAYSADPTETFGVVPPDLPTSGYKLDGIEGYIFSKAFTPPNGTVKLCRKFSQARGDYVLFPGSGVGGGDCTATSFEGGTYDQTNATFGDYIGYVYSVTSDTTQPGRLLANIQTGVFRNTVSPPVSQFILDFDFNASADNATNYGSPGDKGLVADMNNDGRADFVYYRRVGGQGVWNVDLGRDGGTPDYVYYFGGDPVDQPVIGKLHSAAATTPDLAVYRNGFWYITYNPVNGLTGPVNNTCAFGGVPGDVALVGDFNHDGIDDLVIYRNGIWYVHFMPDCSIVNADLTLAFGGVPPGGGYTETPLVADWDRDGIADLIVFRSGTWYVTTRRDTFVQSTYNFGAAGDMPLVGRFNQ
jgi:subtilisin family serine protease